MYLTIYHSHTHWSSLESHIDSGSFYVASHLMHQWLAHLAKGDLAREARHQGEGGAWAPNGRLLVLYIKIWGHASNFGDLWHCTWFAIWKHQSSFFRPRNFDGRLLGYYVIRPSIWYIAHTLMQYAWRFWLLAASETQRSFISFLF